jgi:hypothetical protein
VIAWTTGICCFSKVDCWRFSPSINPDIETPFSWKALFYFDGGVFTQLRPNLLVFKALEPRPESGAFPPLALTTRSRHLAVG